MTPTPYHLLGRTGLRVSRLALGTMTFGTENGWGCDRATARSMFDTYLASGGNFIDTADIYTQGTAETWLGELMAETGTRDRVVLATKYSFNHQNPQGNPNAAGNGRKNLMRSIEASLTRLKTDHVDLYYLHAWDGITPAEEVLRSMDDLVRAGKIRHWALSDVPAWYAARITTLAQGHGLEGPCAVQLEYSLVQRGIEYEFPAMCQELGLGLVAWSPLGGGLLSGKYLPNVEAQAQQAGRIKTTAAVATPALNKLTPRNWEIVAALESVAKALGQPMARVAINWLSGRPALSSVILGAPGWNNWKTACAPWTLNCRPNCATGWTRWVLCRRCSRTTSWVPCSRACMAVPACRCAPRTLISPRSPQRGLALMRLLPISITDCP